MRRLFPTFAGLAVCLTYAAACKDPNFLRATRSNVIDTMTVYAFNGTPASYPVALNIAFQQVLRLDGSGAFDVIFDIDETGKVVLYPTKLLVRPPTGAQRVGIQVVPQAYDDLEFAPKVGYNTDSVTVASIGQTIAIEAAHRQDLCQLYLSPYVYAKVIVDSIDMSSRAIYIRAVMDPNCGFRGLTEGIPSE
jgi:hypothetical protein